MVSAAMFATGRAGARLGNDSEPLFDLWEQSNTNGTFLSGGNHLHANCPTLFFFLELRRGISCILQMTFVVRLEKQNGVGLTVRLIQTGSQTDSHPGHRAHLVLREANVSGKIPLASAASPAPHGSQRPRGGRTDARGKRSQIS